MVEKKDGPGAEGGNTGGENVDGKNEDFNSFLSSPPPENLLPYLKRLKIKKGLTLIKVNPEATPMSPHEREEVKRGLKLVPSEKKA